MFRTTALILATALLLAGGVRAQAEDFDPALHAKFEGYQDFLEEWHLTDLGAITGGMEFTDATRTERACLHHQGDSMIWTGMYLGSQAIWYKITGEERARQNIIDLVQYMRKAMDVTDTPGYIARFVGIDEMPWNCKADGPGDGKGPERVEGVGEWEGYYWIDETSRDQYSGYIFGMAWAYDAIDDEPTREIIRDDFAAIVEMLADNRWNITDQNGEYTGNNAAWVGPVMRLAWLTAAAHVLDEPYYWELLDEQFAANKWALAIDTWSFYNRYSQYYGNNLRHLAFQTIFRLWPDRERLRFWWDVWQQWNRPSVKGVGNPWFDAVHATGCLRLSACDPDEWNDMLALTDEVLDAYWEPPSYQRAVELVPMEADPFSLLMQDLYVQLPWLEDLLNIPLITAEPRPFPERAWTDMYWQSDNVFCYACSSSENQAYTGPGMDYILAYWINVYYGLLPGDGPYGDDDLTAPGDDDDDDNNNDDNDDDNDNDDDDDATINPCCVTGDPCGLIDNGACDCPEMPWDYPDCLGDEGSPTPTPAANGKDDEDDDNGCG